MHPLSHLENIENLDQLKKNKYFLLSEAGVDKTTRGTLNESWDFLNNHSQHLIGNKVLEETFKGILTKLPETVQNGIADYSAGRGSPPSEMVFMYQRYARNFRGSRTRKMLNPRQFAIEATRIIGNNTDKEEPDVEADLVSNASPEEEPVTIALDNRYKWPTQGSYVNVGLEAERVLNPVGQIRQNLASYITVG